MFGSVRVLLVVVLVLRTDAGNEKKEAPNHCASPLTLNNTQTPLHTPLLEEKVGTPQSEAKAEVYAFKTVQVKKAATKAKEQALNEAERKVYQRPRMWLNVLTAGAFLIVVIKSLARLFQGVPAAQTNTPTGWFWGAQAAVVCFAVLEALLARAWLRTMQNEKDTRTKKSETLYEIIRLIGSDRWLLLFAFIALAIAAAGQSTVPFLLGRIINSAEGDQKQFNDYLLYLVGTAAVTGIFTGLRGSTFIVVGARFNVRLRRRLFASLLAQDVAFFDMTKSGEITSRLSADTQSVSQQVELNVNVFFRSLLQAFFVLGYMLWISPPLALTAFVSVPSIVFVSKVFGAYMRKLSKATQESLADANSVAEECISNMRTVKAFSAEEESMTRYSVELDEYCKLLKKQAGAYACYASSTFTFLPQVTSCLVLYYGGLLIADKQLDRGHLVSFVFYMQSLFAAFNSLATIYTGLVTSIGAAEKVFEWINRVPDTPVPEVPVHIRECEGDVRLEQLEFEYPTRPNHPVLSGVSLHAKPGQVIAICGESGGGKSSIVNLLERFYEPSAGSISIDGVPIKDIASSSYYQNVALVGQEPVLFGRSIRENILLGYLHSSDPLQRPSEEVIRDACIRANAHDFICSFADGYDTEVGERGAQLSGGQKQRIAIARALVRNPKVLILDEATSALDSESEFVVQQAIDAMIAQGGMTVIVIAHRLSTIRNADRIIVLKRGVIVEEGSHLELLDKQGVYHKLVTRQMQQREEENATVIAKQQMQ